MKIINKIIIFTLLFILNFLILSFYDYYEKSQKLDPHYNTIDYDYLYLEIYMNNCNAIDRYLKIKINESAINNNKDDLLLLKKCSKYKDDLYFLNNLANSDLNKNENEFIKYVLKYYYFINKNDILNIINKNKFHTEETLIIVNKIKGN